MVLQLQVSDFNYIINYSKLLLKIREYSIQILKSNLPKLYRQNSNILSNKNMIAF